MAEEENKSIESEQSAAEVAAGGKDKTAPGSESEENAQAGWSPNGLESRLSEEAINAWRISGSISSLVYWIIPVIYGAVSSASTTFPAWPAYVLGVIVLSFTIMEATFIPYIRWKRWSYRVDRHEIDLQRGLFVITRTLIPVKRVQHVDTRQGPVYRQFGLASVTITTAGDVHEIPALSESVADDLRHKISGYARVAREDM